MQNSMKKEIQRVYFKRAEGLNLYKYESKGTKGAAQFIRETD